MSHRNVGDSSKSPTGSINEMQEITYFLVKINFKFVSFGSFWIDLGKYNAWVRKLSSLKFQVCEGKKFKLLWSPGNITESTNIFVEGCTYWWNVVFLVECWTRVITFDCQKYCKWFKLQIWGFRKWLQWTYGKDFGKLLRQQVSRYKLFGVHLGALKTTCLNWSLSFVHSTHCAFCFYAFWSQFISVAVHSKQNQSCTRRAWTGNQNRKTWASQCWHSLSYRWGQEALKAHTLIAGSQTCALHASTCTFFLCTVCRHINTQIHVGKQTYTHLPKQNSHHSVSCQLCVRMSWLETFMIWLLTASTLD